MATRIHVVGCEVVTCLGKSLGATWNALVAGQSGIRRHEHLTNGGYLQDVGGIVADFGPGSGNEDAAVAKLDSRFLHLAMAAARGAWEQSGLSAKSGGFDPARVAIAIGSAFGGLDLLEAEQSRMASRKNLAVSPYLIPGMIINQAAGQVSQHLGLYGPSVAPANACASGGHAIVLGALLLRAGEADLAICGAAESAFIPAVVNGFATMKALLGRRSGDRAEADPTQASRPFSVDRAGFVLSEGAGMVVLATQSAVESLGLQSLAVLEGWATNSDGYHMAMPSRDRIVSCLQASLRNAALAPEAIAYYNAHGTSTVLNDKVETEVLKLVFGAHAHRLPISSIKGALGHSLGAASAIEAAITVQALREQTIPPTINHIPDPVCDLDYVPNQARKASLDLAMSASFGFGGTNNALIFRRSA